MSILWNSRYCPIFVFVVSFQIHVGKDYELPQSTNSKTNSGKLFVLLPSFAQWGFGEFSYRYILNNGKNYYSRDCIWSRC